MSEFAKRTSWFFRPKVHGVPVKWDKHKSNKQQQTIGYWVTWYDQIKWYDLLYTLHCYSKRWTKTSVKGDVRFIIAYPSFCWRAIFKYCYSLHNSLISNATLQKNIIEAVAFYSIFRSSRLCRVKKFWYIVHRIFRLAFGFIFISLKSKNKCT